jgi:Ca2+-binding RTX toxin-like protein
MKRAITTLLAIMAAQAAPVAHGQTPPSTTTSTATTYTVVLAGGSEQNTIRIWLTPDGRSYVIDSAAPLEVGGTVCENSPGDANELVCKAPMVAGFEVNAGVGDDTVMVSRAIEIPVTMRGGAGRDTLVGGSGPDKLIGGPGDDHLAGRGGDDLIYGGPGDDVIVGGPGDDVLRGGPGQDSIFGGPGENSIRQSLRAVAVG